jgi:SAM-dependent methyltransferase
VADHPNRGDGYVLGDLYQALSEESRKGRALCQTPRFVTDLLLDLAFDPAYERWGTDLRAIDPSCGTGHILIETFLRARGYLRGGMSRSSRDASPRLPYGTSPDELTAAALAAVTGVDLDPYAALLARYRLLALACRLNGSTRSLAHAPRAWSPQVAHANSLLDDSEPLLTRGRYHVVLANPPYITVKDSVLNERIRRRYADVCSGKYSLALPFFALMNELLVPGGWCAQLTANSFMKREFGRKFIEGYLPRYDLRWVIDTSGAYIPGHGTPTVILAHRNQSPVGDTVNAVLGIRGEPRAPQDPAKGLVWTDIARQVRDRLAFQRFAAAPLAAAAAPAVAAPASLPSPPESLGQLSLLDLMEVAA